MKKAMVPKPSKAEDNQVVDAFEDKRSSPESILSPPS